MFLPMQTNLSIAGCPFNAIIWYYIKHSSCSQNSYYVLWRLTLRFGVIVVEVLFPLCCGKRTHIFNKQVFFVVTAEPVKTEKAGKEFVNNVTCVWPVDTKTKQFQTTVKTQVCYSMQEHPSDLLWVSCEHMEVICMSNKHVSTSQCEEIESMTNTHRF